MEFQLSDFVEWLPNRIIAGAYVNGKWVRAPREHLRLVKEIGLRSPDIKIRRLNDDNYQESLYNLMKAWLQGRGSKLRRLEVFKNCLRSLSSDVELIRSLSNIKLENYCIEEHQQLIRNVWSKTCNIVNTEAKLVSVSKLLHHIFPLLFVPIDGTYTQKFLRNCSDFNKRTLNFCNPEELVKLLQFFKRIRILSDNKLINTPSYLYFDTSDNKTIDNWIVMWVDLKIN